MLYTVPQITKHPGYKYPVPYHDLALVRLARPVTFTDTVRPFCLAAPGQDLPGTEARVSGIGATEFSELSQADAACGGGERIDRASPV